MTYRTPLKKTGITQASSSVTAVEEFEPSGQKPTQGVGLGVGVGSAPGLEVPPPSCASVESVSTERSEIVRSSFLSTGNPPSVSDGRPCERPAREYTPERLAFRTLFNSGRMAEARRLSERMCERGQERVAWVNNLCNVAREQGNLREAFTAYLTNAHLLTDCADFYDAANYNLTFGMTSQALGQLHGVREFFDRALYCYREAARLYEVAGAPLDCAYAENNTGWLLATCTDTPERAHEHLDRAQLLFNDAGETARVADCDDTRALAYEAEGDLEEALKCSLRAVLSLRKFGESERKSFEAACETHERIFQKVRAVKTA